MAWKMLIQHFKLFFKSKIEIILFTIMILSTTIGLTFFLTVPSEVYFTFTFVVRCIVYESLVFMLLSYLFLRKAQSSLIEESIDAIAHRKNHYTLHAFLFLFVLLVIYNLYILLFLIANTIKTGEYSMFARIMLTQYPLNVFLPQIVMLMVTVMISTIKNSKISLPLLLIVALLFSPYMDSLVWQTQPSFPIDKIISYIHLPFALFYQYSKWATDSLYGLQNEPYKIASIAFWILLFILCMFAIHAKKQKMIKIGLTGAVTLASFGCVFIPQNILRLDEKWDGIFEDRNYYDIFNKQEMTKSQEVDYTLTDYHLDIDIGLMLNVDATFQIHSDTKRNDFILTLYHNYDIQNLESNEDVQYKRDGDFIYLTFTKAIRDANISLSYKGYHNIFFSNVQAVQLPGYFAWYPMSGKRDVYFYNPEYPYAEYGYNPYNRVEKTEFHVNINAPYDIVTNLEKSGEQYVGESDSLTIIGGNIARYDENEYNLINYFPYDHSPYVPVEQKMNSMIDDYAHLEFIFDEYFGINYSPFKDKKILVCSEAIGRTQSIGVYSEFDSYVLVTSYSSLWQDYLRYHLINRTDINPYVEEIILNSRMDFCENISELKQNILEYCNHEIINSQYYDEESLDKDKIQYVTNFKEELENMDDAQFKQWLHELGLIILGDDVNENSN